MESQTLFTMIRENFVYLYIFHFALFFLIYSEDLQNKYKQCYLKYIFFIIYADAYRRNEGTIIISGPLIPKHSAVIES